LVLGQTREKTLDALIDSGDATLLDRAVHQLQADMDEKLDARVHELSIEYAQKSMEEVAQEQERLLQVGVLPGQSRRACSCILRAAIVRVLICPIICCRRWLRLGSSLTRTRRRCSNSTTQRCTRLRTSSSR